MRLPEGMEGETVQCPKCGADVPPDTDEHGRDRTDLKATGSGYAVSIGVHIVLLVIAASITWLVGKPEKEPEQDVVVIEQPVRENIEKLQTQLDQLDGPPSEIREVNSNPKRSTPVRTITTTLNTPAETLVGIEIASGIDAPPGDWMSLGTGTGRGGGSGGAGFFGLEARGRNFVYVVDCSSSMYGDRLAAAKRELVRSIEGLGRNMKYHVVFYTTKAIEMPEEKMVTANAANKQNTFAWIDEIATRRSRTNPVAALRKALALQPDAIWFLSDGEFGEFNDAVVETIRDANAEGKTRIHTIAFHSDEGEAVLRRIASENRGEYRFVPQDR